MSYFVYILSNPRHTVFYTGITNDIIRRMMEHKAGTGSAFTKKYNCTQLMYYEEYSLVDDAIGREKKLKKFLRDWKL